MNINYSNLDSIFADAGTDMLTLGDIIESREIMSDQALKEAGKLFLSEMYKDRGPRPNIVKQLKNYTGPVTEEMTKICIRKTSAGYKCRCMDSDIIFPLRNQLKAHKDASKKLGRYKIYNSLAEYFENVTNSISLYVFYKSLRGNYQIKFTDIAYRNIAMGFAKDLELQSFFNNYGLTDLILNYQGPILNEFKKIELYKTPTGAHLNCTEKERIQISDILKNWKTMFVVPKTKKCARCSRELPAAAFSKDMHRRDMLSTTCKECQGGKKITMKNTQIVKIPEVQPIIINKEVKSNLSSFTIEDMLVELRSRGVSGELMLRI